MRRTLFQRMLSEEFYNPAKAKVGSTMLVDFLDYRGTVFTVKEIWEYKRYIGTKELYFTDYHVDGIGKETKLRLRFMPSEKNVLVLSVYDGPMPFNEGLHKAVTAGTGEFEITDPSGEMIKFWRLHDFKNSYKAKVTAVKSPDGKADTEDIEYWDFSCITQDEAKQDITQFAFVELDDSKMQTVLRGEELNINQVRVV